MRLYVTPKGRWAGTQADARVLAKEDGAWIEHEVPTEKAGLLAFLNEHQVDTWREKPGPETAPADRAVSRGAHRWRVYLKGLFACVVHADNEEDALTAALNLTEVREVGDAR